MRIILTDWITERIFVQGGARQGYTISPLIHVLCIVMYWGFSQFDPPGFSEYLGTSSAWFRWPSAKISLYADDTALFLKDSRSLSSLLELIVLFEKGTGAKHNSSKTRATWFGVWKCCSKDPHAPSWVRKMISLSLLRKDLVVNVLGRGKLICLTRVLVLTAGWVLSRINRLKWPFICYSCMETVSRNTCFVKTQSGGLCPDNFDLRCKSLRFVVMTVPFYHVNILSGAGCLALDPNRPFREITLRLVADTELTSKKVYSKLLQSDSSAPILLCEWGSFVSPTF